MTDHEIQQLSQRVNTISDFLHDKRMENLVSDIPDEGSPEYYSYILVYQRDKINELQTQLNKLQDRNRKRINRNSWNFGIGEILTNALSLFGGLSILALLLRTEWPKWIQITLSVIGFLLYGWSFGYQLECSKLWKKYGDKT